MLAELCGELKNYFVKDDTDKHFASFTISGGVITPCDFLKPGQYFRVVGSVLNDGVYRYGDKLYLDDETFEGAVWAMSVPRDVIDLSREINEWREKYKNVSDSPYSSESFGGYSYSKNASGGTWKSVFADRLNRWRKIKCY